MGDDRLAGPCTEDVGVTDSVGALWLVGGSIDVTELLWSGPLACLCLSSVC